MPRPTRSLSGEGGRLSYQSLHNGHRELPAAHWRGFPLTTLSPSPPPPPRTTHQERLVSPSLLCQRDQQGDRRMAGYSCGDEGRRRGGGSASEGRSGMATTAGILQFETGRSFREGLNITPEDLGRGNGDLRTSHSGNPSSRRDLLLLPSRSTHLSSSSLLHPYGGDLRGGRSRTGRGPSNESSGPSRLSSLSPHRMLFSSSSSGGFLTICVCVLSLLCLFTRFPIEGGGNEHATSLFPAFLLLTPCSAGATEGSILSAAGATTTASAIMSSAGGDSSSSVTSSKEEKGDSLFDSPVVTLLQSIYPHTHVTRDEEKEKIEGTATQSLVEEKAGEKEKEGARKVEEKDKKDVVQEKEKLSSSSSSLSPTEGGVGGGGSSSLATDRFLLTTSPHPGSDVLALANEFNRKVVEPVAKAGQAVAEAAVHAAAGAAPIVSPGGFIQLNAKAVSEGDATPMAGRDTYLGGRRSRERSSSSSSRSILRNVREHHQSALPQVSFSPIASSRSFLEGGGEKKEERRSLRSQRRQQEGTDKNSSFAFISTEQPSLSSITAQGLSSFTPQNSPTLQQTLSPVFTQQSDTPPPSSPPPTGQPSSSPPPAAAPGGVDSTINTSTTTSDSSNPSNVAAPPPTSSAPPPSPGPLPMMPTTAPPAAALPPTLGQQGILPSASSPSQTRETVPSPSPPPSPATPVVGVALPSSSSMQGGQWSPQLTPQAYEMRQLQQGDLQGLGRLRETIEQQLLRLQKQKEEEFAPLAGTLVGIGPSSSSPENGARGWIASQGVEQLQQQQAAIESELRHLQELELQVKQQEEKALELARVHNRLAVQEQAAQQQAQQVFQQPLVLSMPPPPPPSPVGTASSPGVGDSRNEKASVSSPMTFGGGGYSPLATSDFLFRKFIKDRQSQGQDTISTPDGSSSPLQQQQQQPVQQGIVMPPPVDRPLPFQTGGTPPYTPTSLVSPIFGTSSQSPSIASPSQAQGTPSVGGGAPPPSALPGVTAPSPTTPTGQEGQPQSQEQSQSQSSSSQQEQQQGGGG
ncbi:hypothetical protein CSUI_004924, partial [Cystoisospora suis]